MIPRADLHTHTRFCDGAATSREMAQAALNAGLETLGFSGHSPVSFDPSCGMEESVAARYRAEIAALRGEYAGRLAIYCGLEKDVYGATDTAPYAYIIGSGHYVPLPGGGFSAVDCDPAECAEAIRTAFGGDPYRYAAAYYEGLCAHLLREPRVDIVGHFDLVTKFNEGGCLFDEGDPRYRAAALDALDAVAAKFPRFEINTGAMSRKRRSAPYPAPFLLERLRARGGRIVLSSDSHNTASLGYAFAEAAALAQACGFAEADVLTEQGFVPVPLG